MVPTDIAENEVFAARQLAQLVRGGVPIASAYQRLAAEMTEPQRRALQRLGSALGFDSTADTRAATPPRMQVLGELYRIAGASVAAAPQLLLEYQERLAALEATLGAFWSGARNLLLYTAGVLAAAAALTVLFSIAVYPGFESMFEAMNAPLPPFTQAMFGAGGVLATVLLALAVAFWVAMFVLARRMMRQVGAMRPIPPAVEQLPLFGELAREYNLTLALNYAQMLRAARLEPEQAWRQASSLAALRPQAAILDLDAAGRDRLALAHQDLARLAVAHRLGTLGEELTATADRQQLRLVDALANSRARALVALRFLTFFVVGTLLVAMYLPIFKLGSVV